MSLTEAAAADLECSPSPARSAYLAQGGASAAPHGSWWTGRHCRSAGRGWGLGPWGLAGRTAAAGSSPGGPWNGGEGPLSLAPSPTPRSPAPPAPPPTSGSAAASSSLDGSRPARSRCPRAPAPPAGTGVRQAQAHWGPPGRRPLLTSTSSQWKKWMSGLLCSESWHTSSSTEGYRSWFSTVWLCRTVGSGKFSSSSWGGRGLGCGSAVSPGPTETWAHSHGRGLDLSNRQCRGRDSRAQPVGCVPWTQT